MPASLLRFQVPAPALHSSDGFTVRTWHLLAVLTLANWALVALTQRWVMTDEFFRMAIGRDLTVEQMERLLATIEQSMFWQYASAPLLIVARASLAALVVQTFCLLYAAEVPFAKVFRATTFGLIVKLAAGFGNAVYLFGRMRVGLHEADIGVVTTSLSSYLLSSRSSETPLYLALNQINMWELSWILLVGYTLSGMISSTRRTAWAAVISAWLLAAFLKFGLQLYVLSLFG